MMYGYGYEGWGILGWVIMGTAMLLLWGGLAALIIFLIRGVRSGDESRTPAPHAHDDPERILAQRFARGEIDEPEYQARLGALRRG